MKMKYPFSMYFYYCCQKNFLKLRIWAPATALSPCLHSSSRLAPHASYEYLSSYNMADIENNELSEIIKIWMMLK